MTRDIGPGRSIREVHLNQRQQNSRKYSWKLLSMFEIDEESVWLEPRVEGWEEGYDSSDWEQNVEGQFNPFDLISSGRVI